jgi:hypothetical protein
MTINKMKRLTYIPAILLSIGCTVLLASCSSKSDTGTNPPNYTPIKIQFKAGANAYYEILAVDTANASGNMGDQLDTVGAQYNVQDIVIDTNYTYHGKTGVTAVVTGTAIPDTEYYYQSSNGDLYRYNYGFSIVNKDYPSLLIALGSPLDVGWVLVAKPGVSPGTTWTAVQDSQVFQSLGAKIYLSDVATAMNDTTFYVSKDTIKALHVRHIVTASAPSAYTSGTTIVDTYISAQYGLTVEDFFHHMAFSGVLLNKQAPGSYKLMTSLSK